MTFPVNYEDTPSAKNWIGTPADDPTSVTYEEGIYIGYRLTLLTYNLLMNLDTDYRIPHSIILILH
jgi:beta-glucosidase